MAPTVPSLGALVLTPGGPPGSYFFMHIFDEACHLPPAFSQSAFVVYFDMSVPDGLAEGVVPEPDEVEPPPVLPFVPEGVLLPELELPPPLLVCAAAIAGASAMIPTRSVTISFCMRSPPVCGDCPAGLHSCRSAGR